MSEVNEIYNTRGITITDGGNNNVKFGRLTSNYFTSFGCYDKVNAPDYPVDYKFTVTNKGDIIDVGTEWVQVLDLGNNSHLDVKFSNEIYVISPVIQNCPLVTTGSRFNLTPIQALLGATSSEETPLASANVRVLNVSVYDASTQERTMIEQPTQLNYGVVQSTLETHTEIMLGISQGTYYGEGNIQISFYGNGYVCSCEAITGEPDFNWIILSATANGETFPYNTPDDKLNIATNRTDTKGANYSYTVGVSERQLTGILGYNPFDNFKITETDYGEEDDNPEPNEESGGGGDQIYTTDNVEIPPLPSFDVNSAGFVHIFNPNQSQMTDFISFINGDGIMDKIKALWSDPMDSIIGLAICPFIPAHKFNTEIHFAGVSTEVTAPVVQQFQQFDFGTITVDEFFKSYLDYSGTKIILNLPFIGEKELSIYEVMHSNLHLVYQVDFLTGTITAFLTVTKIDADGEPSNRMENSVLYNWTGNCFAQLPMTGTNYSQVVTGIVNAVIGVAGGAVAGSASMAGGAVAGLLSNLNVDRPTAGTVSPNSGLLGVFKPYIIIQRPHKAQPTNFTKLHGHNSQIYKSLNSISGYNEIEFIDPINIDTATDQEIELIRNTLRGGVYF